MLESHLQILFSTKNHFVGSQSLNLAIKFVASSTRISNTMEKLKPYVEKILTDTIIQIMLLTEKDMATFENEPVEYIRDVYDYNKTIYLPRSQI